MARPADKFAEASGKFSAASTTIGTYDGTNDNKKKVLDKLAQEIAEGINAMKEGLTASAAPAPEGSAPLGGSKNKKNNKDKDNKDKKSKNNR